MHNYYSLFISIQLSLLLKEESKDSKGNHRESSKRIQPISRTGTGGRNRDTSASTSAGTSAGRDAGAGTSAGASAGTSAGASAGASASAGTSAGRDASAGRWSARTTRRIKSYSTVLPIRKKTSSTATQHRRYIRKVIITGLRGSSIADQCELIV